MYSVYAIHGLHTHSVMLINSLPGATKGLGLVYFTLLTFMQTWAMLLEK